MQALRGKKALVTGAASGIGRAIAKHLAMEGADVYLVDINEEALRETREEILSYGVDAVAHRCDLSQPEEIDTCAREILSQWQWIDVLVNNAGISYYGTTEKTPQEMWDKVLAVNLYAPIRLTKQLLPMLKTRPEAHVLNVASMYGLFATNRCAAYHTSKFGLVGFSQALLAENGRDGLGVTTLCPGFVDTGFYDSMEEHPEHPAKRPPRWLCISPDRVARKAMKAIRRNKNISVVSPLAHTAFFLHRLCPGLLVNLCAFRGFRKFRDRMSGIVNQTMEEEKNQPPSNPELLSHP